jgi:hypothetical protein
MDIGSMPFSRLRAVCAAALVAALWTTTSSLPAQSADPRRRPAPAEEAARGRGGFSAEDAQGRLLTALRQRLDVADDEEWALISERVLKIYELRRSAPAAGVAGRGFTPAGPAAAAAARGGPPAARPGGSPELQALQSAINDRLPDAEVKLRLAKVRQARRAHEAALEKAQEQLRAVLTIRQEAIAVTLGLLP